MLIKNYYSEIFYFQNIEFSITINKKQKKGDSHAVRQY